MNKVLIAFLIIGLMIATTACSSVKTDTVKTDNVKSDTVKTDTVKADTVKTDTVNTDTVTAIADIKKDELLGKTVTVQGIVVNNLKTRSLSGYRLKDATDSIPISSQNLPKINTTKLVTGTLQKGSFFGYYIVAVE